MMSKIIFLNKFRGFNNTYIELKQVNFFIGENSTGKTSVLKVIKVLSDPNFWLKDDFKTLGNEFGYFDEITEDEYFEIGISTETRGGNTTFILLRFTKNDGLPEIYSFKLIDKFSSFYAIKKGKMIKYQIEPLEIQTYFTGNNKLDFENWIVNNHYEEAPINSFKLDKNINLPLLYNIHYNINKQVKGNSRLFSYNFLTPFIWLAPIRTEPKRTYDNYQLTFNPDGTHTPYLLKSFLKQRKNNQARINFEQIINGFGLDSGLFEKIEVMPFGKANNSPFELNVFINNRPLKITNVGYGISQILPLIVEISAVINSAWFAVQQPEIHMHPRAQAAFGDLVYKSAVMDKKNFIIETHSDYTIDRYRLKLNANKRNHEKPSSQIVFFYRKKKDNKAEIVQILEDGSYSENQPKEFKEFFIKEQLALLKM